MDDIVDVTLDNLPDDWMFRVKGPIQQIRPGFPSLGIEPSLILPIDDEGAVGSVVIEDCRFIDAPEDLIRRDYVWKDDE